MSHILLIETATKVCSVGLARGNKIIALREDRSMQYSHSSLLTTFIDEVFNEAGIGFHEADAVAVSMGPGSYTGLRIGVSAAKGLCYALDIPLIAVNTLHSLAATAAESGKIHADFFVPMIDARRMEVYNAVYDKSLREIRETAAEIIDGSAFSDFLEKGKVAFFGDGAPKCREVISHKNAQFYDDVHPGVKGLLNFAIEKFCGSSLKIWLILNPFI
jgi:tRNA threonylcarbamoyladenosine biosynthesis protein TsaB